MPQLKFKCRHRYASGFLLDADFEADDGVTALCGPSGSGKTTILSLIAGLLRPQEGCIQFGDRVLVDRSQGIDLAPERRGVGMVFQEHRLFPHLKVEGNLCYGQKRSPASTVDFTEVVETLELGDLLNRYPLTLSGGQRQRVALGRALLQGPELLLMDEPLVALEPELKDRIVVYLERALSTFRVPTLLVSHDTAIAGRLARHVVLIENGKIMRSGTGDDPPQQTLGC